MAQQHFVRQEILWLADLLHPDIAGTVKHGGCIMSHSPERHCGGQHGDRRRSTISDDERTTHLYMHTSGSSRVVERAA
jgi:hypothetical protein